MPLADGTTFYSSSLTCTPQLSAHVTRVLGQNPGLMTLQGTNSYLLQPPSNPLAPIILIDTSSPHTSQQYVDLLMTHLMTLGLESGTRETHFESPFSKQSLENFPKEKHEDLKAHVMGERLEAPTGPDDQLTEYGGPNGHWTPNATKERRLPPIEHVILTHRHLDHVGALPTLLNTLKEHGLPPPKIWKFPSPDEAELQLNDRDRPTTDSALWQNLPQGTYHQFSPFQAFHPIMPGLMISIIDPVYRHLLKHDKEGKPKWNDVPEIARVSLRCLRTPGHTADSVSLVLCEGEKGIFTGDTVLGQGTTVFTDLASCKSARQYLIGAWKWYTRLTALSDMISLKTLLALKPSTLYPAHGPHIAGQDECAAHLTEYITHRQERENQIVSLLQAVLAEPEALGRLVEELMEGFEKEKVADTKWTNEFLTGKPYIPPRKKAEAKEKGESKDKKEDQDKATDKDKDGGKDKTDEKDEDARGKDEKDEGERKEGKAAAKYPKDEKALPVPLICQLIYKSPKDALIFAASKSIGAHLVKLEGEGKVRRKGVKMPKIVEGKIGDDVEQEGWEWVGELRPEDLKKHL